MTQVSRSCNRPDTPSYRVVNRLTTGITRTSIMGRKKIQIKKIEDHKLKTITFTRRRNGLLKKAYELSVLCDTRVCVLMFDSKDMCHVYSSVKEDKDGEDLMTKFISKSFTTIDPRRKYDTSPDLQLDETSTPWRVTTQENNVAIVNTYTVQPNGSNATTPGAEGASPGDDDDDGDGLDQLSVKFTRNYHVNKSSKKSPRKGSVQAQQGMTPPASTTFSPPIAQAHFLSPGETPMDPLEYAQQQSYEGLGIAHGMIPAGYTLGPVPQYIASPNMATSHMQPQYLRSPVQMMSGGAGQPLQSLQGNPHIQRSPARMMPVLQPISPMTQQGRFQAASDGQQGAPPRLVRQQTQPLPRQMTYDENTLIQAALISQIQQQHQQLQQEYYNPQQVPQSPQRAQKPVSRSVPSSPEKRRYANQLAQVSELDMLSIPASIVPSSTHSTPSEPPLQEKKSSHLRGISFLDELFEAPSEDKGPLAPDGTLREDDRGNADIYDDATLEADVNAWLEGSGNLGDGPEWLDQVVLS